MCTDKNTWYSPKTIECFVYENLEKKYTLDEVYDVLHYRDTTQSTKSEEIHKAELEYLIYND